MIENLSIRKAGEPLPAQSAGPSVQPAGCLCKKQVFYLLRPHSRCYYSKPIDQFFTDELLQRCGITRDEMKRIRVFPPEINFVVITHLKTLRLL